VNPGDKTRVAIMRVKPKPAARQLWLLIALSTVTRHRDGWRKARIETLAGYAGLSPAEATRARNELAGRGLIEYRPGLPGGAGSYRITVPEAAP
jgi:hypothetical protein